jgi:hypothetical protein
MTEVGAYFYHPHLQPLTILRCSVDLREDAHWKDFAHCMQINDTIDTIKSADPRLGRDTP